MKFLYYALGAILLGEIIFFGTVLCDQLRRVDDIIVPRIVGLKVEDAVSLLEEKELAYEITYKLHETENLILETFPKENQMVKEKALINLYVSKKPSLYVMPSFINQYLDDSKSLIGRLMRLGIDVKINYEVDNDLPPGVIFKTVPEAMTSISNVSEIYLYVSVMEALVYIPDFSLQSIEEVTEFAIDKGITITFLFETSLNIPKGYVIKQNIKDKNVGRKSMYEIEVTISNGIDNDVLEVEENDGRFSNRINRRNIHIEARRWAND